MNPSLTLTRRSMESNDNKRNKPYKEVAHMRHMDLFSGIGGFALAASWVWGDEHEIVTFCEKEEFPRQVLKKHWPDVPCHTDIYTMNGGEYGTIDLVTGGFPCQPFSQAGKQKGVEDDRYLWPETLRIIQESRPRWFVGENVAGIINMALDEVLASLESAGYTSETFIIPACAVNAQHRRDRVWIVAHSECDGWGRRNNGDARRDGGKIQIARPSAGEESEILADADSQRLQTQREQERVLEAEKQTCSSFERGSLLGGEWYSERWELESRICRMVDGVSNRVDRIRGLGNAIVPQVAAVIMSAIKEVDRAYNADVIYHGGITE